MAIDGTWKISVDTPMGKQDGTLALKAEGTTLTGTQKGASGTMIIENGKIEGNKLTWAGEITQPFAMKLTFEVMVNGDQMTGEVKAGGFGSSPLKGTRVG